jgi:hypothetical protein
VKRRTGSDRTPWFLLLGVLALFALCAGVAILLAPPPPTRVATGAELGYGDENTRLEAQALAGGELLLYVPAGGRAFVLNPRNGFRRPLTARFWRMSYPRFRVSPDGKRMVAQGSTEAENPYPYLWADGPEATKAARLGAEGDHLNHFFAWYPDGSRVIGLRYPEVTGATFSRFDAAHPETPPMLIRHPVLEAPVPVGKPPYQPFVLGFNRAGQAIALDFATGTRSVPRFRNASVHLEFFFLSLVRPSIPEVGFLQCTPSEGNPDPAVTRSVVHLRPGTRRVHLSLSPDGERIAWVTREYSYFEGWQLLLSRIWPGFKPQSKPEIWERVYVSGADGGGMREVAASPVRVNDELSAPAWSVDGRDLYYFRDRDLYRSRVR